MLKTLTNEDIKKAQIRFPEWDINEYSMQRKWIFKNFSEALAFIIQVGISAELLQHHPTFTNTYNTVEIYLTTHDVGNKLTSRDLELAQRISSITS